MKILLITDSHNPNAGGAEKYFFTLKNALTNSSDVVVVSMGFGSQNQVGDDFVVFKETSSKFLQLFWRIAFNPWQYWKIRRHIRRINPDVIHLHNYKKYTFSVLKALRGYTVIQTIHDYTPICPTYWNIHTDLQPCTTGLTSLCWKKHRRDYSWPEYFLLLYWFLRVRKILKSTVKTYLAPSPQLTHFLHLQHFHPAVFISHFNEPHRTPNEEMIDKHFLFIGQLGKHKGVHVLLNEFALACAEDPELILSIAGTGKEMRALIAQASLLGIEKNVRFLGWVSDTRKLYAACTALILPSLWLEAFGLVTLEAMSYGRAVIGSHRGPTPWLVEHGKTGLLFDPLKKGNLATQILWLARNSEKAKEYGSAALEKMCGMPRKEEVIEQILVVYQTLKKRK